MHWATLLFTSEITFLFGLDVALLPVVPESRRGFVRLLWGLRIGLLAIGFTLLVEGAGAVAVGVVFGLALFAYIGSWSYTILGLPSNTVDPFLWAIAHISVVNWALAFPLAVGSKGNGVERSLWLTVNLVIGLIVGGYFLTSVPLNEAYGCYPAVYNTSMLGAYGICPESRWGTTQTCTYNMDGELAAYPTCANPMVRNFGGGAVRAAIYTAAGSIAVYLVSIGRTRRKAGL